MSEAEIYQVLAGVVEEVLGLHDLALTPETVAEDVEGWDSMMHINIVVGVQSHFGIRLTTRQIDSINTVGDLVHFIEMQLNP